jgi:hypothetical protein
MDGVSKFGQWVQKRAFLSLLLHDGMMVHGGILNEKK